MIDENQHDVIFKALGDARRRRILDLLKQQPMKTGELCKAFPELNRCTVMQHLGVLEKAELIIVQRKGRCRWNYLNSVPIKEVFDRWLNAYALNTIDFLTQLKRSQEGM